MGGEIQRSPMYRPFVIRGSILKETAMPVGAPGVSKELTIKATEEGNVLRVEITQ